MTSAMEPPLKGIRVVELTHTILGPSWHRWAGAEPVV